MRLINSVLRPERRAPFPQGCGKRFVFHISVGMQPARRGGSAVAYAAICRLAGSAVGLTRQPQWASDGADTTAARFQRLCHCQTLQLSFLFILFHSVYAWLMESYN